MKTASKVFLIIGSIVNFIAVVILVVFCVLIATGANVSSIAAQAGAESGVGEAGAKLAGNIVAIILGIAAAIELIIFILAVRSYKALNKPGKQKGALIALLVFGILGVDIPYILGAAFGIASESQEGSGN